MSQHPSLRIDSVGAKHRNVLKRFERVKKMEQEQRWSGRTSAYGLPKIKSLKIKIKAAGSSAKEEKEAVAAPEAAAKQASPAGKK